MNHVEMNTTIGLGTTTSTFGGKYVRSGSDEQNEIMSDVVTGSPPHQSDCERGFSLEGHK